MKRFKNHLIAAAVLSMLAIIGTIMNSHQAAAQPPGPPGGLAVNIVNPVPVPVTGSINSTVTGTVGLASGASVRVDNTVTDPVRVRNVNDAIQPFQAQGSCTTSNSGACSATLFTVPTGKRAVIEYFSGSAIMSAGQVLSAGLQTIPNGLHHLVPTTPPAPNGTFPIQWGQQVRLYADGGSNVSGEAVSSGSGGSAGFNSEFIISGYLVDVPFTP